MNLFATAAALLIAFIYMSFLRQIDLFEKERRIFSVFTFLLGCAGVLLLFVLQANFPLQRLFNEGNTIWERFRFHAIGVAVFEETVKLLPLLLLLPFRKPVDEPFDYIKYASLGALGFATVENVLYFNRYSLEIVEARAFYTAIMHMFTTSWIGYSMMQRKRAGKTWVFIVIPSWILAVCVHGIFNALVSSNSTYSWGVVFCMVLLVMWGRMMNNALNVSPFFNEETARKGAGKATFRLLMGWLVLFGFVALGTTVQLGMEAGIRFVGEGASFGFMSGLGLYWALGRPKLERGMWRSLIPGK